MVAKGHVGRSMEQDGGTDGHAPRNSCHAALTPCVKIDEHFSSPSVIRFCVRACIYLGDRVD